jgi:hypothetical protein
VEDYIKVSVLATIIRFKFPNLKGQNARKLDVNLISTCGTLKMLSVAVNNEIYNFKQV